MRLYTGTKNSCAVSRIKTQISFSYLASAAVTGTKDQYLKWLFGAGTHLHRNITIYEGKMIFFLIH
jgi:hypothetical protein